MTPVQVTKKSRVLAAFMRGEKHTRFSAARVLHDHCLPSTVSELQSSYGIVISRQKITIPGFGGAPTNCCEYWIDVEEQRRFRALVDLKQYDHLPQGDTP